MSAPRFKVLERGPILWRILDRKLWLVEYVVTDDHGLERQFLTREFETHHGPAVRDFVAGKLLERLQRGHGMAVVTEAPIVADQPTGRDVIAFESIEQLQAYVQAEGPILDHVTILVAGVVIRGPQ